MNWMENQEIWILFLFGWSILQNQNDYTEDNPLLLLPDPDLFQMWNQWAKSPFTPSGSINSAMMSAILFSLNTMESLANGLQLNSGVIQLRSMRTVLLASSQSSHSVDADAWCKRALTCDTLEQTCVEWAECVEAEEPGDGLSEIIQWIIPLIPVQDVYR